jgi:hypothetical protein
MMRRILILIPVLLAIGCLLAAFRQHRIAVSFDNAVLGSSDSDVKRQLGNPWKRTSCGQTFGGDIPKDCASESLYASPFAPAVPEYWAFRFGKDGRLIDKYHYVSP